MVVFFRRRRLGYYAGKKNSPWTVMTAKKVSIFCSGEKLFCWGHQKIFPRDTREAAHKLDGTEKRLSEIE